jgi:hypothetical protein
MFEDEIAKNFRTKKNFGQFLIWIQIPRIRIRIQIRNSNPDPDPTLTLGRIRIRNRNSVADPKIKFRIRNTVENNTSLALKEQD